MTVKSMTGFARVDGGNGRVNWVWELRSVNGRGLDLRLRLPPGFEALEPLARDEAGKCLSRGSVSATLSVERVKGITEVRVNEAALEQILKAVERLNHLTGCERPTAEGLLGLKGVLEVVESGESEAEAEATRTEILASFGAAVRQLVAARAGEGRRLREILETQVAEIARLTGLVEASPARGSEAIKQRLKEQVAKLVDSGGMFDEQRLHQEAVLLAARSDVEEELKRLHAHVEAARELLAETGAVGRKLDFLTQEFNREANTLCSKANDTEITRMGLALKAVIDQMREQVQNIE